jgi:DNA-directed RNA polymerase
MSYHGGYYMIQEPFLKFTLYEHTASLRRPVSDEILYVCDVLGRTPLRINTFVLGVIEELVERSETVGRLPEAHCALPPRIDAGVWADMTGKERVQVKVEREYVHSKNATLIGRREALSRKVQLAGDYVDETFWIPHCPDFRGRLYPQSQDLNFTNDDVSRGLIQFAEGKPYGETGKYWLKVRLANSYGLDKLTFDERVQWVDNNSLAILDSAKNPLDGSRFWIDADEPFQFLAAANEYRSLMEQGDKALNYLPINLDATASGLQHLSAWSRDPVAAEVVNMTSSENRYDIYGIQAEEVNKLIARDLGVSEAARNCHGHVTRKTVKRGVMTIPYSVTPKGLRDQFIKDGYIDELSGNKVNNANYLRDILLESLGETIRKPMQVMTYFKGVANALALEDIPLQWRTPMGMTVRQAYWRQNKQEVKTLFGKAVLWNEDQDLGLMNRKQTMAASPNVIHSFDAAHLQSVVLMGTRETNPITSWACVHDSIGVHACEVERLNRIIREEYVRIYDRPVLEEFHDYQLRHGVDLPDPPDLGSFKLNEVMRADYFFS